MHLERWKDALLLLLLAAFGAALLLCPREAAEAARQALALCLQTVLPSLFPFFTVSSLAVASGAAELPGRLLAPVMRPLFGVDGAGSGALALGLAGGYPVGARTAAELYRGGALEKEEAERLLGFCSNAGPGFLLGVCGGAIFGGARAGLRLLLVHAVSAVLTGVLLRPRGAAPKRACPPARRSPARPPARAVSFPVCVRESFAAAWSVCGFVVLFSTALRLLTLALPAGAEAADWYPALLGFVELTGGVLALRPDRGGFVLCAVLLGWGGLSVHAQTLSVLEGTGLSTRRYFLGKALQAALSAPLAMLAARGLFG